MEYNGGGNGAPPSGEGDSGLLNISNPHPNNDVLMGRGCE